SVKRGLLTLAGLGALSLAFASATALGITPLASATTTPTTAPTTVHSCSQSVTPGTATCFALRRTDAAVRHFLATPNATPAGFGPASLDSAYKLSSSGGAGQTVGIVDAMDDPNAESDLATYRTQFGLPACTTANGCFKKVNQNGVQGQYPRDDIGWSQESALDLDMASAMCPSCKIILVEASSATLANLAGAVDTAVNL